MTVQVIEHEGEDGTKIPVVPHTEYENAQKTLTEKEESIKKLESELADVRRVSAEKTENFKKFNQMTEEERKNKTENEIILLKRGDKLEEELESMKKEREEEKANIKKSARENAIGNIAGDKAEIKDELEKAYDRLNMPENTPEEVRARANEAAKLIGIQTDPRNPLYSPIDGQPPTHKEKKDYVETPEGQKAADMVRSQMGLPKPADTK